MPSFYPYPMSGHLPLTPPEFVPSYDAQAYKRAPYQSGPYMGPHSSEGRQDIGYDYSRQYPHAPSHPGSQAVWHESSLYEPPPTLPPINSYYEPMGAPMLPPLRIQERTSIEDDMRMRYDASNQLAQQQQQQQQQQSRQQVVKEEKATGGVSAKLDYEMEKMTDFVAEAAQGIIQPTLPINPSFRKWVLQVLSATRLPSATIMLSLYYLTVRLRDHPPRPSASENQIYRLVAVALILGSKFLDDNTFINRSWSDVSGIKVTELNELEMDWLAAIQFDLHCDPNDPSGLATWLRAWKEYDTKATLQRSRPARLSPLNTNIQRNSPNRNTHSPYQHNYPAKGFYADYTPQSTRSSSTYSGTPYMSADPWNHSEPRSTTNAADAFYNPQHRYPAFGELDRSHNTASQEQVRRASNAFTASLPLRTSMAPSYIPPWNRSSWATTHPHGCNCLACSRNYMSYLPTPGYAAQPVVG